MKIMKRLFYGFATVFITAVMMTVQVNADTSDDFEYSEKDGKITIDRYKGKGGVVTIPAEIDGKPVRSIGNDAFSVCTGLTSITIPNSVTSIGEWAFYGCTGLASITIPNSVTTIESRAFSECTGLTSIIVTEENKNYTSIDGILFSKNKKSLIRFPQGKGSKIYNISNSVTSIGEGAFYGCTGLTGITIPNSVTSIGEGAFSECTGLTGITIPNSVTSIGKNVFFECKNLTISGYKNSYAEKYAKENNIPFKPLD